MFALLTDQGTAAAETALCDRHVNDPRGIAHAHANADTDVVIGDFTDCSENDALVCIECGEEI